MSEKKNNSIDLSSVKKKTLSNKHVDIKLLELTTLLLKLARMGCCYKIVNIFIMKLSVI